MWEPGPLPPSLNHRPFAVNASRHTRGIVGGSVGSTAGSGRIAAGVAPADQGLTLVHYFQLNVSALCGIGGEFRVALQGLFEGYQGVLWGITGGSGYLL